MSASFWSEWTTGIACSTSMHIPNQLMLRNSSWLKRSNYACAGTEAQNLVFPDGVNNLASSNWQTKIHSLMCHNRWSTWGHNSYCGNIFGKGIWMKAPTKAEDEFGHFDNGQPNASQLGTLNKSPYRQTPCWQLFVTSSSICIEISSSPTITIAVDLAPSVTQSPNSYSVTNSHKYNKSWDFEFVIREDGYIKAWNAQAAGKTNIGWIECGDQK